MSKRGVRNTPKKEEVEAVDLSKLSKQERLDKLKEETNISEDIFPIWREVFNMMMVDGKKQFTKFRRKKGVRLKIVSKRPFQIFAILDYDLKCPCGVCNHDNKSDCHVDTKCDCCSEFCT